MLTFTLSPVVIIRKKGNNKKGNNMQKHYDDIACVGPEYGQEVCDVCLARPVPHTWIGPENFQMGQPINVPGYGTLDISVSADWAICQTCHELLIKNDWDGLLQRAIKSVKNTMPPEAIAQYARDIQETYSRLRKAGFKYAGMQGAA